MFFRKTVDSVIADIQARISDLHAVAEVHSVAAELHTKAAYERAELAQKARAEFARAKSIASKFADLIS